MSVQHTATPWRLDDREHADWGMIIGPDGLLVADACVGPRYTEDEAQAARRQRDHLGPPTVAANAAFIITAVNSHDALVKALAEMIAEVRKYHPTFDARLFVNAERALAQGSKP